MMLALLAHSAFCGAWMKDASGYLASALVLCTFSVRSMRLLRMLGIASNLAFILYGMVAVAPPILFLHGLLLPMNIFRLVQLERTTPRSVQPARRMLSAPAWMQVPPAI